MNSGKQDSSNETVVLNDTQKSILQEMGLSTNYEDLSFNQKDDIVAIDKMLTYIEKKYDVQFTYEGFEEESTASKQKLYVYPSSGVKGVDTVTVEETSDGYTDDYLNVAATDLMLMYSEDQLKQIITDSEIRAFPTVTSNSLPAVPKDISDLDGKVVVDLFVYVDGNTSDNEKLKKIEEQVKEWAGQHSFSGTGEMVLLKENLLSKLNMNNYTDYLMPDSYITRETINLK